MRGALVNGFQVFADNLIPLLVMGFVVSAVGAACRSVTFLVEYGGFYSLALILTVAGPLELGLSFVCLRAVRSGRVNLEHLIAISSRYLELVLANLLLAMIFPGLMALMVVPWLVFYCATRFVPYLLLEDELSGAKAIVESVRLSRGCFWQLVGICFWPLVGVGVLAYLARLLTGVSILSLVPALIIWWNLSLASLYHAKVRPPEGWAVDDAEEIEMLQAEQD